MTLPIEWWGETLPGSQSFSMSERALWFSVCGITKHLAYSDAVPKAEQVINALEQGLRSLVSGDQNAY